MCFYKEKNLEKSIGFDEEYVHPQIAKENIYCYKTMSKKSNLRVRQIKAQSIIRRFEYKEGKTYKTTFLRRELNRYNQCLNRGFHSFRKIPSSTKYYVVVLCMIPKGTKYFKNKEQYCSESIKIIRFYT